MKQSTVRFLRHAVVFVAVFLVTTAILIPVKYIPAHRAYQRAKVDIHMKKNLKLASWAMEKRWESGQPKGSYRDTSANDLSRWGFEPTDGVTIVVLEADDQSFKLKATAEGGTVAALVFDSRSQAIAAGR